MGIPCGCGPGLKTPIGHPVSCVATMGFRGWGHGAFVLLTFSPTRIVVTTFLEVKMRILVVDPDLGSVVVFPTYNRYPRRLRSFNKISTLGP